MSGINDRLKLLRNKYGVYKIFDKDKQLIYIGKS